MLSTQIIKAKKWVDFFLFLVTYKFCVPAVSDYKKRSYKKQPWIFVKIKETSTGKVKIKKRIKKLKKRSVLELVSTNTNFSQCSDFQSYETSNMFDL